MRPTLQFRLLLLAWLVGLWLGLWASPSLALIAVCLGALLWWQRQHWWWLCVVMLGLGSSYHMWYAQQFYPPSLAAFVGESIELQAVVRGEPRVYGKAQTVRLSVQAWRQGDSAWQPYSGQLLWRQAPLPVLGTGDILTVGGTVVNVINFSEDFNARAYYSRWGIGQELIRGKVVQRPPPNVAPNQQVRAWAETRLSHHLADPHRTVALGMLVGLKDKLPKSLDEAFKEAGLTHLLVVSGTNVTLLILALSLVLKPLGPWLRYGLGVVAIGAYLYLVGFDPPALRASLLGVLTGLALTVGYFCEYRNLLLLVAALLGLLDPHFVTHDVSFWLSFAATAGMLLGVPVLYRGLSFVGWRGLRLLLAASITAQCAVFPLLIVQFGSFPYAGLVTNLITEPLVPLIMLLGAGGIALGEFSLLGFESLWSLALWSCLQFLIWLAQSASLLPDSVLPVWLGWIWGGLLLVFGLWAGISSYYQRYYWEKLEAELA